MPGALSAPVSVEPPFTTPPPKVEREARLSAVVARGGRGRMFESCRAHSQLRSQSSRRSRLLRRKLSAKRDFRRLWPAEAEVACSNHAGRTLSSGLSRAAVHDSSAES